MKKTVPLPELSPESRLIDTHCHLDMADYQADLKEVLAGASRCGVTRIITIGIDLASSRRAVELAQGYEGVHAAVGIHPHDAATADEEVFRRLTELAAAPKVVGYGEIGLDYAKNYSPKDVQLRVFARQLELAKELRLPLIIHDRDAHEDTLRLLRDKGPFPQGGVMHCFSGDAGLARQVLDIGFYISIPGIVTFPNAAMMREAVREVPSDRLLLETDGPFLAPVPFRGKCNLPQYLLHTAAAVAELKGVSLDEIARQTTVNAEKLFFSAQEQSAAIDKASCPS
jgi:TatD DNase family protein